MSLVHSIASLQLSLKSSRDKLSRDDEEYLTSEEGVPEPVSPEIDSFYAWVIVCASFTGHVITYGIAWTVGIFYVIFLAEFQQSPVITSWVGTINSACTYLGGPISSALAGKFGGRAIITLGCLISTAGLVLSSFAKNIYFLLFSFSIVTGIGLGIAYVPIVTTVGLYFDKYRNAAVGIAVAGIGFGTFVYPSLINTLVNTYTWRGAFIILGGVNLHLLIIASIMRDPTPPPPTMKESLEMADLTIISQKNSLTVLDRTSILASLELGMFKNPYFLFLFAGNFFSVFGLSIIYIHLNSYASSLDFSTEKSSMLLSVIGIANLLGRIVFGFIGQHPKVNPLGVYSVSMTSLGLFTFLCPLMNGYPALMLFSTVFGILSAPLGTVMAEMLILIIGIDRLTVAFGYQLAAQAFGFLIGGPIAGVALEAFNTYVTSFFMAGAGMVIGGVLVMIPWNRLARARDYEDDEYS